MYTSSLVAPRVILRSIILHPLLHPRLAGFGMLLHGRLVLEHLLELIRLGDIGTTFERRSRPHALFPRLERWELINVDACPAGCCDPAPVRKVGDLSQKVC